MFHSDIPTGSFDHVMSTVDTGTELDFVSESEPTRSMSIFGSVLPNIIGCLGLLAKNITRPNIVAKEPYEDSNEQQTHTDMGKPMTRLERERSRKFAEQLAVPEATPKWLEDLRREHF